MATIASEPQSIQPLQETWAFIDRVYCISLEHRLDRQQQAKEQFARVGLENRVEFLISQKHPSNAELGNFNAQMNAIRSGLDAGAKHILVFEDDIVFDRFSLEQLSLRDFIHEIRPGLAYVFFRLLRQIIAKDEVSIGVEYQVSIDDTCVCGHRGIREKLVATPWPGRCLDDLICSLNDEKMYAVYPAIAFQSNSPTDNDKQIGIDRFRRALGGIRRLQKWNEFASLNFMTLIVVHGIILLLVLMIAGHFMRR